MHICTLFIPAWPAWVPRLDWSPFCHPSSPYPNRSRSWNMHTAHIFIRCFPFINKWPKDPSYNYAWNAVSKQNALALNCSHLRVILHATKYSCPVFISAFPVGILQHKASLSLSRTCNIKQRPGCWQPYCCTDCGKWMQYVYGMRRQNDGCLPRY